MSEATATTSTPKEEEEETIAADTASTTTSTSSATEAEASVAAAAVADDDGDNTKAKNIQDILHETKVDGGKKSLWAMTIETMGMSDGGKTQKEDVHVDEKEEGVQRLKEMLENKQNQDVDYHKKWDMDLTPFVEFHATIDDLLRTFVQWSYKDETKDFNITKAFRRLESYVTWMDDNRKDLEQPKLTKTDKEEAHKLYGPMLLTRSSTSNKTLVYWIDLTKMESKSIKSFDHGKTLRYILWTWHYILLCQQFDDMIIVENVGQKLGFIQFFTFFPPDLGAKFDRLTMGVMPIKMKSIYFIHNPKWMNILLLLMKPFLSKKMRQRMIVVNPKEDLYTFLNTAVGPEAIPCGFCDLDGSVEKDELAKLLEK